MTYYPNPNEPGGQWQQPGPAGDPNAPYGQPGYGQQPPGAPGFNQPTSGSGAPNPSSGAPNYGTPGYDAPGYGHNPEHQNFGEQPGQQQAGYPAPGQDPQQYGYQQQGYGPQNNPYGQFGQGGYGPPPKKGLSGGVLAAIIIGVVVLLGAVAGGVLLLTNDGDSDGDDKASSKSEDKDSKKGSGDDDKKKKKPSGTQEIEATDGAVSFEIPADMESSTGSTTLEPTVYSGSWSGPEGSLSTAKYAWILTTPDAAGVAEEAEVWEGQLGHTIDDVTTSEVNGKPAAFVQGEYLGEAYYAAYILVDDNNKVFSFQCQPKSGDPQMCGDVLDSIKLGEFA